MNETIVKFGYPATLVREYSHWLVLLRPQQPTLGSLVLAAKSDSTAFSDLEPEAFAELQLAIRDLETALKAAVGYDRINYLMLMMVDPHVHFHVIPRYEGERSAAGLTIEDAGWPKLPDLGAAAAPDESQIAALTGWLKPCWPRA
jgi:diadenosine tetraphosphate (Ap4A) HIT family hydrolase